MTITKAQLAALLRLKPRYAASTFTQAPYLCPETFVGDTVDYSEGVVQAGYPTPTKSVLFNVGGTQHAVPYTVAAGDVGKAAQILQISTNEMGSAQSTSASVTVAAIPTFGGLGLLGANVKDSRDYTRSWLYTNAVLDSRGFGVNGTSTGGGVALDANGWPIVASSIVITATPGAGLDGQLAAGTYLCQYKSTGHAATVTLGVANNCSISSITNLPDGVTTTFTLTVGAGAVCRLDFSAAIQFLDVPRDGSTPSSTTPTFHATPLAYYAQFASLRLMDFLNTNFRPDTNWASRSPETQTVNIAFGTDGTTYTFYSWERTIAFINAVVAYPGSKVQKVWVNIPARIDTSYATQLSALFNALLSVSVILFIEVGNEPWNSGFATYGYYKNLAATELQAIANYAITNTISSVVGNGTTATVTLTGALPAYITNGAPAIIFNTLDTTWNAGAVGAPATVTVTGSNTFTYPCTGSGTMTGSSWAAVFNTTSNLITDGLFDMNAVSAKYYVRTVYGIRAAWLANRASDRFVVNMKRYGGTANAGATYEPTEPAYAAFINGGSATWLYGFAVAPYIGNNGSDTTVDLLFASMTVNMTELTQEMRSHVFVSRKYGVHPICYEAAPATTATPTLQIAAHTDARMGAAVTTLITTWFQNGGEEFHFFTGGPAAFVNTAQGAWGACQTYADTASPKVAALLAMASAPRNYANLHGAPGTMLATDYQYNNKSVSNGGLQGTTNAFYWFGTTNVREIGWVAAVPRTRRMSITVWGSDSVLNTKVSIVIDGVVIGQSTLPNNGAGSSGATTYVAVADPITTTLTAGPHDIVIRVAAGVGASPGIFKVAFAAA